MVHELGLLMTIEHSYYVWGQVQKPSAQMAWRSQHRFQTQICPLIPHCREVEIPRFSLSAFSFPDIILTYSITITEVITMSQTSSYLFTPQKFLNGAIKKYLSHRFCTMNYFCIAQERKNENVFQKIKTRIKI